MREIRKTDKTNTPLARHSCKRGGGLARHSRKRGGGYIYIYIYMYICGEKKREINTYNRGRQE